MTRQSRHIEELRKMSEFLTFTLGEEEYAIDILKVQEIRGYEAVTRIA
ncbi:MAG: chemotaxis protein CheW, partial [Betaproteobacteria bacterium]